MIGHGPARWRGHPGSDTQTQCPRSRTNEDWRVRSSRHKLRSGPAGGAAAAQNDRRESARILCTSATRMSRLRRRWEAGAALSLRRAAHDAYPDTPRIGLGGGDGLIRRGGSEAGRRRAGRAAVQRHVPAPAKRERNGRPLVKSACLG